MFEWCDGPLVDAMRNGEMFLIDEISLADDSVLERLNSVLESDHILVLSEKGEVKRGENKTAVDILKAHEDFRLIATMNPGGDFGKKEVRKKDVIFTSLPHIFNKIDTSTFNRNRSATMSWSTFGLSDVFYFENFGKVAVWRRLNFK